MPCLTCFCSFNSFNSVLGNSSYSQELLLADWKLVIWSRVCTTCRLETRHIVKSFYMQTGNLSHCQEFFFTWRLKTRHIVKSFYLETGNSSYCQEFLPEDWKLVIMSRVFTWRLETRHNVESFYLETRNSS